MEDRKRTENMFLGDGEPGGVLQTWIDGNLDTVHAGFTACIDVLDQCRTQINERVNQTLDWAEANVTGVGLKQAQDQCHFLNLRLVEVLRGVSFLITPAMAALWAAAIPGKRTHPRTRNPFRSRQHISPPFE